MQDQASHIAALYRQRSILLQEAEVKEEEWQAEREGWDRTAEAIIVGQRKASVATHSMEGYERRKDKEEKGRDREIKTLKTKVIPSRSLSFTRLLSYFLQLAEAQGRLHFLESELARLPPLLLMQPLVSSQIPPPAAKLPSADPTSSSSHPGQSDPAPASAPSGLTSSSSIELHHPDVPGLSPYFNFPHVATPRPDQEQYDPGPSKSTSKRKTLVKEPPLKKAPYTSFTADARAEHLLLAAQVIGKKRAGLVAGMIQESHATMMNMQRLSTPLVHPAYDERNKGKGREGPIPMTMPVMGVAHMSQFFPSQSLPVSSPSAAPPAGSKTLQQSSSTSSHPPDAPRPSTASPSPNPLPLLPAGFQYVYHPIQFQQMQNMAMGMHPFPQGTPGPSQQAPYGQFKFGPMSMPWGVPAFRVGQQQPRPPDPRDSQPKSNEATCHASGDQAPFSGRPPPGEHDSVESMTGSFQLGPTPGLQFVHMDGQKRLGKAKKLPGSRNEGRGGSGRGKRAGRGGGATVQANAGARGRRTHKATSSATPTVEAAKTDGESEIFSDEEDDAADEDENEDVDELQLDDDAESGTHPSSRLPAGKRKRGAAAVRPDDRMPADSSWNKRRRTTGLAPDSSEATLVFSSSYASIPSHSSQHFTFDTSLLPLTSRKRPSKSPLDLSEDELADDSRITATSGQCDFASRTTRDDDTHGRTTAAEQRRPVARSALDVLAEASSSLGPARSDSRNSFRAPNTNVTARSEIDETPDNSRKIVGRLVPVSSIPPDDHSSEVASSSQFSSHSSSRPMPISRRLREEPTFIIDSNDGQWDRERTLVEREGGAFGSSLSKEREGGGVDDSETHDTALEEVANAQRKFPVP